MRTTNLEHEDLAFTAWRTMKSPYGSPRPLSYFNSPQLHISSVQTTFKMFALFATITGLAAFVAADSTTACSPQPVGYGPVPTPNTEAGWLSSSVYGTTANKAVTPSLYQRTYVNLNGSSLSTSSNVYLGYNELTSYDPAACTAICDKTSGCVGTNLYFERSPSLAPAAACPNPAALVVVKCALWGSPISAVDATNVGQWQESFHVLVSPT